MNDIQQRERNIERRDARLRKINSVLIRTRRVTNVLYCYFFWLFLIKMQMSMSWFPAVAAGHERIKGFLFLYRKKVGPRPDWSRLGV